MLLEIERDHEFLNKNYIKELKKGEDYKMFLNQVQISFQTMVNNKTLCSFCEKNKEIQKINDLFKEFQQKIVLTINNDISQQDMQLAKE